MRADNNLVKLNVSHQQPEQPKTVVSDRGNNFSCSRVQIEYPVLSRLSAAIMQKSSPARATTLLKSFQ